MYTLKQAKAYAANIEKITGKRHLVFRVPEGTAASTYPGNVFNTGKYATCEESEKAEYEADGAVFVND
jgi:hypothetical protein